MMNITNLSAVACDLAGSVPLRRLVVFLLLCNGLILDGAEISFLKRGVIRFGSAAETAEVLVGSDPFVEAMSPFDRSARLKSLAPVSLVQYQAFVGRQALDWDESEVARFSEVLRRIERKLEPFPLRLPVEILFGKTTGEEEGQAAYCRSTNVVIIPAGKATGSPEALQALLAHELFHILSRNDPDLRDAIYAVFGFRPRPRVDLPEPFLSRRITNPDAPQIGHSIEVRVGGRVLEVAPVLYSSAARFNPAEADSFFHYLTFKLMAVGLVDGAWAPLKTNGAPELFAVADVEGFFEQIGRNTRYLIHPEELSADNFVMMLDGRADVPNPALLSKMRAILSGFVK